MSTFAELSQINVNAHTEKKGNLTYLSWAWAVDQLLRLDNGAKWEYRWNAERPYIPIGETAMVFCTVYAFGVSRTAQLPVMDNRNRPIPNPNAFELNTAMQRCLAKAIALHGIGLYVYAGEDLPTGVPETDEADEKAAHAVADFCIEMDECEDREQWKTLYRQATKAANGNKRLQDQVLASKEFARLKFAAVAA